MPAPQQQFTVFFHEPPKVPYLVQRISPTVRKADGDQLELRLGAVEANVDMRQLVILQAVEKNVYGLVRSTTGMASVCHVEAQI